MITFAAQLQIQCTLKWSAPEIKTKILRKRNVLTSGADIEMTTIVAVIDRFAVFNIKNISTWIVSLLQKWFYLCNFLCVGG